MDGFLGRRLGAWSGARLLVQEDPIPLAVRLGVVVEVQVRTPLSSFSIESFDHTTLQQLLDIVRLAYPETPPWLQFSMVQDGARLSKKLVLSRLPNIRNNPVLYLEMGLPAFQILFPMSVNPFECWCPLGEQVGDDRSGTFVLFRDGERRVSGVPIQATERLFCIHSPFGYVEVVGDRGRTAGELGDFVRELAYVQHQSFWDSAVVADEGLVVPECTSLSAMGRNVVICPRAGYSRVLSIVLYGPAPAARRPVILPVEACLQDLQQLAVHRQEDDPQRRFMYGRRKLGPGRLTTAGFRPDKIIEVEVVETWEVQLVSEMGLRSVLAKSTEVLADAVQRAGLRFRYGYNCTENGKDLNPAATLAVNGCTHYAVILVSPSLPPLASYVAQAQPTWMWVKVAESTETRVVWRGVWVSPAATWVDLLGFLSLPRDTVGRVNGTKLESAESLVLQGVAHNSQIFTEGPAPLVDYRGAAMDDETQGPGRRSSLPPDKESVGWVRISVRYLIADRWLEYDDTAPPLTPLSVLRARVHAHFQLEGDLWLSRGSGHRVDLALPYWTEGFPLGVFARDLVEPFDRRCVTIRILGNDYRIRVRHQVTAKKWLQKDFG